MKKNVLLLLVLGVQPLFSMCSEGKRKAFRISPLNSDVSFSETYNCDVREELLALASNITASPSNITALALLQGRDATSLGLPPTLDLPSLKSSDSFRETYSCTVRERLLASPSNISALALLRGRHARSSVSPTKSLFKMELGASSVSLAGSSPVELVSPCSKSPSSLAGFRGASSEQVLKPTSMLVGMMPYDASRLAVSAEPKDKYPRFSPIVGVSKPSIPSIPMRRLSSSQAAEDVDSAHKDAQAKAAMMKLYFGK